MKRIKKLEYKKRLFNGEDVNYDEFESDDNLERASKYSQVP